MAIRKYGTATGVVTGIEEDETGRTAARREPEPGPGWTREDDQGLAAENRAADGPQDDD